jgi:thiamine transport system ATP-binding protein
MLTIKDLKFTYHDTSKNKKYGDMNMCFNLDVKAGEIISIIGSSGSGKTTLLNLVAGFNKSTSGELLINGKNITQLDVAKRPVTTVFQAHNLFPHLDVFTNIAIGIKPSLKLKNDEKEQIQQALENVGLSDFATRLPRQLSGGQQQRVALARALVRKQEILLLDEPLAALGPAMREEIILLIKKLVADKKMAALFVSHQPSDALLASSRCAFIHQGKVLKLSDCESMLNHPSHPEIKEYLGTL